MQNLHKTQSQAISVVVAVEFFYLKVLPTTPLSCGEIFIYVLFMLLRNNVTNKQFQSVSSLVILVASSSKQYFLVFVI